MWKALPKHKSPRMSIDSQLNQSLIDLGLVHSAPFSEPPTRSPLPMPSQNVRTLARMYRSISLMALSLNACAITRLLRACKVRSRQLCVLGAGWTKAS